MAKRKIIEIERDLCDGCGLCTTACLEGALEIDGGGKAVLVREIYCDGLGACLDVCPTGALKIVERESETYDAEAAFGHVLETRGRQAAAKVHGAKTEAGLACGCPGSRAREIRRRPEAPVGAGGRAVSGRSELGQWPVQLRLVSPLAPYFEGADLLVAADCTAFAMGSFHQDLLKGRRLVIACPKLDRPEGYVEKLAELFRRNSPRSVTVAIMTVPCCAGLLRMVEEAAARSGTGLEPRRVVIDVDGTPAG